MSEPRVSDFPTAYTLEFVTRHLPPSCRRILEIGSGDARLARALLDLGYDVTAIDPDESAVAAAKQLGVTAIQCAWPRSPTPISGFDAVLFSRSLHHVQYLDEAVERAREALTEGGRILIEDFAFNEVDRSSASWFSGIVRALIASGGLTSSDPWILEMATSDSPLAAWARYHDHDLHPFSLVDSAMRRVFRETQQSDAAYFFRYLSAAIDDPRRRGAIQQAVASGEESLAATGAIRALGRRIVARRAG